MSVQQAQGEGSSKSPLNGQAPAALSGVQAYVTRLHSLATLNAKLCYRLIRGVARDINLIFSNPIPNKEVVCTLRAFKLNVSGLGLACWSADQDCQICCRCKKDESYAHVSSRFPTSSHLKEEEKARELD
jgi:hypothetical protein